MSDPDASADGEAAATPSRNGVPATAGTRSFPAPATPARRRIWPWFLVGLVALVLVGGWIAARVSVNYYVLTPGDATPVSKYIEVPQQDNHPLTGKILLTDVYVSQLNALNYLYYSYLASHFGSTSEVVPGGELLGSTPNEDQYLDQGYLQMAQAQSFATAAALTHLGYAVNSTDAGALIYGVADRSPASRSLNVGQVITAVNGTSTSTDCGLIAALHGITPGTSVTFTIADNSINNVGAVVPGPTIQKEITLAAPPKGLVDTGCGSPTRPTAYLGIDPQTQLDWRFPVPVTVHTQNIGGPSAGLAMSLGIIDKLSSGRLTGHRIVAATGTIDQYGNVGDVGGVAEKTIAVEHAGATVFFVPSVELKTARSKASPQLHVYAVNNLSQVLHILKHLGGSVPSTPVPAQAAP